MNPDTHDRGPLARFLHIAREYVTHWTIAGTIVALTGAAPDHLIGHFFKHPHLPEWMHDYRIAAVSLGVAIIVANVLVKTWWKRPTPGAALTASSSSPSKADGSPAAASELAALPALLTDRPSIAVLPFDNLSGDREQDYFADGIAEDLITALSRARWLFVLARNSSFTYKGRAANVLEIGKELGVRYVLEGSVRRAGNRLRITAQLIEANSGSHIWADRYDRDMEDVFKVQDEVVQQVVAAIEPNLEARETIRSRGKPTESLDAYDLFLRARPLIIAFTESDFRAAAALLQQATGIDPHYSDAWAALAICRLAMASGGWNSGADEEYGAAIHAARRAIASGPGNGRSLGYAARVLATSGGNIDEAVELAHRSLDLHPNSAEVQTQCGWVFVVDGNSGKALECFEAAGRLNPLNPYWHQTFSGTAAAYIVAGRFDEALHRSSRVLDARPRDPIALRFHVIALSHLGRAEEARAAMRRILEVQPHYRVSLHRWSFRSPAQREIFTGALLASGGPE